LIAGRRSKTVAFVAILALTTFGALATASAQPADIKAIDKAFQDHYARGNYPAAQIDAQKLEQLAKARFGADHPYYAVALNKLGIVFRAQGKYGEAEGLFKRALVIRENRCRPYPSNCRIDGYSTDRSGRRSSGTAGHLLSTPCRQSSRCSTQAK
jgi:tetratricopeptide (TPR) repeat protein